MHIDPVAALAAIKSNEHGILASEVALPLDVLQQWTGLLKTQDLQQACEEHLD